MSSSLVNRRTRGTRPERLTQQQLTFVNELAADPEFKSSRAAAKAGYKNPHQAANKLLHNSLVAAAIGKVLNERLTKLEFKAEDVLRMLATALFFNPLSLFKPGEDGTWLVEDLTKIPEEVGRCIKKIKTKTRTDKDGNTTTYFEMEMMDKDTMMGYALKHFGLVDTQGNPVGDQTVNIFGNEFLGQLLTKLEQERGGVIDAAYIERKASE